MTNLALTSILLSLLDSFLQFADKRRSAMLVLQSVISVIMAILVLVKYRQGVELRLKQLIRKKRENPYLNCIKSIWLETIILLVHPNIFSESIVIQVAEPIYGESIPLEINDILEIVMLGRIYLLYDSLVNSSIYCTTRASRMCRIYSTKDSSSFGPKSFFNAYPLHSLTVLYVSLVIIFSKMLSLA
jgi:hypothetical protein